MPTTTTLSPQQREILETFDKLPDAAIIPTKVTARLLGLSEKVIRRHPRLPRISLTAVRYGQRAGDIRAIVRGEAAAP